MAITLIGTPQVGHTNNGGNVTLTFSQAPLENDYVVVWGGAGKFRTPNPAAPGSGYTELFRDVVGVAMGIWCKKMSSSPDTNVVCYGTGDIRDSTAYGCHILRGVDPGTFLDVAIVSTYLSNATPDCPSITPITAGAWVLAFAAIDSFDSSIGTISGYSNQYGSSDSDTTSISAGLSTKEIAVPAAENPGAWSTWSSGYGYAVSVAVRPAVSSAAISGRRALLGVGA